MQPETQSGRERTDRTHGNRRRFLKGVGAATMGAVALTGTASAQQYQFEGCARVCGDTHADLAVVATDDGFDCRPITEAVDSSEVPWDWAAYCYEATADEAIVGAIEESAWKGRQVFETWACELELNPNDCADEHYENAYQVKRALDGNDSCGACAGTIVSGDGDGITATDYDRDAGSDEEADAADSPGDDSAGSDDGSAANDGGDGGKEPDGPETATSVADTLGSYIRTQFGL